MQERKVGCVYITKYALTKGIYEERVVFLSSKTCVPQDGTSIIYNENEWHYSPMEARKRARVMRDAEIESLKNKLRKLNEMVFEEKDIAVLTSL